MFLTLFQRVKQNLQEVADANDVIHKAINFMNCQFPTLAEDFYRAKFGIEPQYDWMGIARVEETGVTCEYVTHGYERSSDYTETLFVPIDWFADPVKMTEQFKQDRITKAEQDVLRQKQDIERKKQQLLKELQELEGKS